jgi:hypothetical protein
VEPPQSSEDLSDGTNFKGKLPFQEMINLSKTLGDSIVIGFSGGREALENSPLAYLEQRLFKWDDVKHGLGKKIGGIGYRGRLLPGSLNERLPARGNQRQQQRLRKCPVRSIGPGHVNSMKWSGFVKNMATIF